jgi:hypothetical protein
VLYLHLLKVLFNRLFLVVRNAHHDDVLVLRQVVHLVFIHLPVVAFSRSENDALVRLEESTENLLPLILKFGRKQILQVVSQVVLCKFCHVLVLDFLSVYSSQRYKKECTPRVECMKKISHFESLQVKVTISFGITKIDKI